MSRAAIAAAALALGGCALLDPARGPPTPAERGHAVAQRACAACHAIEPGGVSPRPPAPAFGGSEMRHTAGIENRVADLTRLGHYGMPPVKLTPAEVADLVAYIETAGPKGQ